MFKLSTLPFPFLFVGFICFVNEEKFCLFNAIYIREFWQISVLLFEKLTRKFGLVQLQNYSHLNRGIISASNFTLYACNYEILISNFCYFRIPIMGCQRLSRRSGKRTRNSYNSGSRRRRSQTR